MEAVKDMVDIDEVTLDVTVNVVDKDGLTYSGTDVISVISGGR